MTTLRTAAKAEDFVQEHTLRFQSPKASDSLFGANILGLRYYRLLWTHPIAKWVFGRVVGVESVEDPLLSETEPVKVEQPLLRVMYPLAGVGVGGSVVSTADMVIRLRRAGLIEPVVLVPRSGPASDLLQRTGIEPHYLETSANSTTHAITGTGDWRGKLRAIPAYIRLLRKAEQQIRLWKPDLIHLNSDRPVIPWGLAAKRAGVPVVWHVRQEKPNRILDPLRLRLSDHLIFVADANRSRFAGLTRLPPSVRIYNSIEIDRFGKSEEPESVRLSLGLHPSALTLTFLGSLVPRKRPEWVLRAAAGGRFKQPLQILLVGPVDDASSYGQELRRLARMIDPPSTVHFMGLREDVPTLLSITDVLALPSQWQGEAFPRAIIEAMASGVPVVATDVAGVSESVDDGRTGLLVKHDDFDGFERALIRLVNERSLRDRFGEHARSLASARFSGADMADDVFNVYSSVLRQRKGDSSARSG
jgi:glycosyltransferase involved in cell wall biosynthesis